MVTQKLIEAIASGIMEARKSVDYEVSIDGPMEASQVIDHVVFFIGHELMMQFYPNGFSEEDLERFSELAGSIIFAEQLKE